jgi:hypothetical protein
MEMLQIDNPAVLAYWRIAGEDRLLCIYNLGPQQQSISLDLSAYKGGKLTDLLAADYEEVVTEWPVVQILAPYASHWLRIDATGG